MVPAELHEYTKGSCKAVGLGGRPGPLGEAPCVDPPPLAPPPDPKQAACATKINVRRFTPFVDSGEDFRGRY